MTQWERAVEAAASEIFDEGVFDVDGAETEEKTYCREVAAAALRAALPIIEEAIGTAVLSINGADDMLVEGVLADFRRALEAEASP